MDGAKRNPGWRPATVTHARLRAEQGDVEEARATLREILQDRPSDVEAARLLRELDGRVAVPREEPPEEELRPVEAGEPGRLAARFRAELRDAASTTSDPRTGNLRRWLDRIARKGG